MNTNREGSAPSPRPLPPWARRQAQQPAQLGVFQPPPSSPAAPTGKPPKPSRPPRPKRRHRGVDATAIGSLMLGLPWLLYSAALVTAAAYGLQVVELVVPLWLVSGALVAFRPVEAAMARLLYRYRSPTSRELDVLRPAWEEVAAAAGVHPDNYQLWIQDSDDLNASASAGHLIAVTRRSLDVMPPHQLRALLAHEFGHHAAGHSWSDLLMYWYSLPGRACNRVLAWLVRAAATVAMFVVKVVLAVAEALLTPTDHGGRDDDPYASLVSLAVPLVVLAAIVTGGIYVVWFAMVVLMGAWVLTYTGVIPALVLLTLLVPTLEAWLSRRSELRADRAAARLGYGQALIDTLEDWIKMGAQDGGAGTFKERLLATHPPLDARIRRLKSALGTP